jgi:hypothetical protein
VLVVLGGCAHWHYEKNAPGHIDVTTPPRDPAATETEMERPDDPGERMVLLQPGLFGGAGFGAAGRDGTRALLTAGAEISLQLASADHSHTDDFEGGLLPDRALALNLGWSFADSDEGGLAVGPLYGELQLSTSGSGIALGWAVDPDSGQHGPQLTAFLGPFFARADWFTDRGVTFQLGIMIKAQLGWVWSR